MTSRLPFVAAMCCLLLALTSSSLADEADPEETPLPGQRVTELTKYGPSFYGRVLIDVQVVSDQPGVPLKVTVFGCHGKPVQRTRVRTPEAEESVIILPKRYDKLGAFTRIDVTWRHPEGDQTLTYGTVTYPPTDRNRDDKACRFGRPPRLELQGSPWYATSSIYSRLRVKHLPVGSKVTYERWVRAEQRWAVEATAEHEGGRHIEHVRLPVHGANAVTYRACSTTSTGLTSCSMEQEYTRTDPPPDDSPQPEPRQPFTPDAEQALGEEILAELNRQRAEAGRAAVVRDDASSTQETAPYAQHVYESGAGPGGPTPRSAFFATGRGTNYDPPRSFPEWLLGADLTAVGLSVFWDEYGGHGDAYYAVVIAEAEPAEADPA